MWYDELHKLTYDNRTKILDILSYDLRTILRHDLQNSYNKS